MFTDRSGINYLVGAEAIAYNDHHSWSLSYGLGLITQHMVFEGKLVGVILTLKLLHIVPATMTTAIGHDTSPPADHLYLYPRVFLTFRPLTWICTGLSAR